MSAHLSPVYEATRRRCIEEQHDAALHAQFARTDLRRGLLGRAAQEQRNAAYCADQARIRLDLLNGHA